MAAVSLAALAVGQMFFDTEAGTAMADIELPANTASGEGPWRENNLSKSERDGRVSDEQLSLPVEEVRPEENVHASGEKSRSIRFDALPSALDVHAMPVLGEPEAEHVIVEMLDYTCSHCRKLHPRLQAARERYGDQLAIVLYHVPLSDECNRHLPHGKRGRRDACAYAELAIKVWKLAPKQFSDYHNWLLEAGYPPSVTVARRRAVSLAGDQILLDEQLDEEIRGRVDRQCAAWQSLKTALPLLVFRHSAALGAAGSDQEIFDLLENKLPLRPLIDLSQTSIQ